MDADIKTIINEIRILSNKCRIGAVVDNSFNGRFRLYAPKFEALCDAYEEAQKRITDLEYFMANHSERCCGCTDKTNLIDIGESKSKELT